MEKTVKKPGPWLTVRADQTLKARLERWKKKFRRASTSDAARIILEDRLNADGVR